MITLKLYSESSIENNLADYKSIAHLGFTWESYLRTFPHITDVEWRISTYINGVFELAHTIITFDSEEAKNWFILRWS